MAHFLLNMSIPFWVTVSFPDWGSLTQTLPPPPQTRSYRLRPRKTQTTLLLFHLGCKIGLNHPQGSILVYQKLHACETDDVVRVLSVFSKALVRHVDLFQFWGLWTATLMGIITDVVPSKLWV